MRERDPLELADSHGGEEPEPIRLSDTLCRPRVDHSCDDVPAGLFQYERSITLSDIQLFNLIRKSPPPTPAEQTDASNGEAQRRSRKIERIEVK